MKLKKILVIAVEKIDEIKINKIKHKFKTVDIVKHTDNWKNKLNEYKYIFICKDINKEILKEIVLFSIINNKEIYVEIDDIYDLLHMPKMYNFDDLICFRIKRLSPNIFYSIFKRIFDIVFSLFAIILTLPIMLITAILVKLDSKGNVFYIQKRITKNGKEFNIIKFRTMKADAEKMTGPVLATEDDERITKIGKFLRKYKIDELPQFFNVLKGDMSVVGPRPERKFFADKVKKEKTEFEIREKVKAGMTCLAHIIGDSYTSFEDRIIYDIIYIQRKGIIYDIKMIFKTVRKIFIILLSDLKKKLNR